MRVPVILIDRFTSSAVSENGYHMVLTLRDIDAEQVALGIPCERLPELIEASARAMGDSERVLRRGCDMEAIFDVTWWRLHRHRLADSLVLSLTFGSGGQLSFALPREMTLALRDTMTAHLVESTEPAVRGFGPSEMVSSDTKLSTAAIQ